MRIKVVERGSAVECTGSKEDVMALVALMDGTRVICVIGTEGGACAIWPAR